MQQIRWSSRAVARRLFELLVAALVPDGPVVVAIDETLERRWGARIRARGIYRDPVRSSRGHFVKASGLRWISAMLLTPIPRAGRVWALPFLTVLAPSARFARAHGRRHKALTERARQILLLVKRWLPDRPLVAVADSSYAAILLLDAVRAHLTTVTVAVGPTLLIALSTSWSVRVSVCFVHVGMRWIRRPRQMSAAAAR